MILATRTAPLPHRDPYPCRAPRLPTRRGSPPPAVKFSRHRARGSPGGCDRRPSSCRIRFPCRPSRLFSRRLPPRQRRPPALHDTMTAPAHAQQHEATPSRPWILACPPRMPTSRCAWPSPVLSSSASPRASAGALRIGQRVMVPLRGGRDVGYVVGLSNEPKVRGIRPIERVLDPEPHLPPDLLELMLWIAHHYLSPIGMVLRAAVPQAVHYEGTSKAVARERQILTATVALPVDDAEALLPDLARRAPAQAEALAGLCRAQGKPVPATSFNRAALEGLQKKGLVTLGSTGSRRGILPPLDDSVEPAPLTPAQTAVFARILPALAGGAKPLLVQGVTGSGKTELYLRAIRALPPDRQALLLVPEVSLTIQLIRHLRERLPFPIAVWHHQLSDGEKFDLWRAIRRGEVRTVVGTRSALFAPLPRLGLIVVDEEQEASFKQEETPCYHARDAAIVRAGELRRRGDPGFGDPEPREPAPGRGGRFHAAAPARALHRPAAARGRDPRPAGLRRTRPPLDRRARRGAAADRPAAARRGPRGARAGRPGALLPQPPRLRAPHPVPGLRRRDQLPELPGLARLPRPRAGAPLPLLRLSRRGAGHLPGLRRPGAAPLRARAPSGWSWRSARLSRGARSCASTATPPRARAPARRWSPISRAAAPTSSSGRSWSPRGCTSRG